jgi:hypothetical protein
MFKARIIAQTHAILSGQADVRTNTVVHPFVAGVEQDHTTPSTQPSIINSHHMCALTRSHIWWSSEVGARYCRGHTE